MFGRVLLHVQCGSSSLSRWMYGARRLMPSGCWRSKRACLRAGGAPALLISLCSTFASSSLAFGHEALSASLAQCNWRERIVAEAREQDRVTQLRLQRNVASRSVLLGNACNHRPPLALSHLWLKPHVGACNDEAVALVAAESMAPSADEWRLRCPLRPSATHTRRVLVPPSLPTPSSLAVYRRRDDTGSSELVAATTRRACSC